jgi:hypothetical protein
MQGNERQNHSPVTKGLSKYNPKEAWVVNISLRDEEMIEKTRVRFIPVFEML